MRIPEHKLNEMRKNPKDKKMVEMFFNSIFLSIDAQPVNEDGESMVQQLPDNSEPYTVIKLVFKKLNEKIFNKY